MKRGIPSNIKQLAALYANSSVSPKLVTDYALDDAVKLKNLNAFVYLNCENAFHSAKESEYRYFHKKPKGLLDGITIALKDNFCTNDVPTSCSSRMLKDFKPAYNATVYQKLLDAGAILIGKTNMDEFGMGSGTIDSIFGPTKNVWSETLENDDWNISGGSSGGSATAVASGICYAALGSDTGGSTRNPASYCGVVGYKPSYGLVSRYGLIPLVNSMDVPGVLTRTVDDCCTILNCIAGPDEKDSTTVKQIFNHINLPNAEDIDISNLTIGIPKEYHCTGLSPEVLETWIKVADILEEGGAKIVQVSLPYAYSSIFVYSILNQCEVSSNMARYDGIEYGYRSENDLSTEQLFATTRAKAFNSVVKGRILAGNYFLLRENYEKYFLKALKVRRLISNELKNIFNGSEKSSKIDILLTPTTLSEAPLYKDFKKFSNADQCASQDFCTQPANMVGIPAISVPIRLLKSSMPIGVQLMAKNFSDELLLNVAKWIESKVDFNCLENIKIFQIKT